MAGWSDPDVTQGARTPDETLPASPRLTVTLNRLVQTIVDELGFETAVMNYVESEDCVRVVAVAGPADVRDHLSGSRTTVAHWHEILDGARRWGALRFLDHRDGSDVLDSGTVWTPSWLPSAEQDDWHPEDALFAPLRAADGSLLGVLSVDLPPGAKIPDQDTRDALIAFGVSASLVIEHALLQQRAEESEQLFREVFSSSQLGMALADAAGVMSLVNAALSRLLGSSAAELVGQRLTEVGLVTGADDKATVVTAAREGSDQPGSGEQQGPVEYWCTRPDGSRVHLEVTATPITGGRRQVLQLRDITEERDAVRRLRHLASHDPGTEVGNRSLLIDRLRAALVGPDGGQGAGLALLFVDLDGFKRVNDVHSHAMGDHVLRVVAQRLARVVRPVDTVARWGGDEFIVLVDGLSEDAAALALVRRIQQSICQQITVDDTVVTVSSSVGVVFSRPGDGLGVEELLRHADSAMYVSKREGSNRYSVFNPSAQTA